MFLSWTFLNAQTGINTDSPDETSATSATNTLNQDATKTTEEASFGVTLTDTIPPVIKLIGLSPLYLKTGTVFMDPGALAYDNHDGDISTRIIREHNVNTQIPGTYRVMYGVADRAGNKTRIERVVIVIAPVNTSPTEPIRQIEDIKETTTMSEPVPIPPPATTTIEPINPPTTQNTTATQTEINRILDVIRSENIERIEAEKHRILEEARRATMRERATTTLAIPITPRVAEKIAELRERRPTTTPEIIQEKLQKIVERRDLVTERAHIDSDRDGVSDYDEDNIYKTDANNPDTDDDGYSDGSEILGGYDPLDPNLQGRIIYEDPRERGEIRAQFFAVAQIAAVEIPPPEEPSQGMMATEVVPAKKIEFKGKGLPNSFVTLYIFSTPIVVTVRTDEEGNWEYVLDKELEDGSHELHVAMTDDTGKILVKGSPIPFVKTAQAITVDQNLLAPFGGTKGTSLVWNTYMYAIVLSILAVIGATFVFIGMRAGPYARRYRDDEPNGGNPDGSTNVE